MNIQKIETTEVESLTDKEILEFVRDKLTLERDPDGNLRLMQVDSDVGGNVFGNVGGHVVGSVGGDVCGDVGGDVVGSVCGDVGGNVGGNVDGYVRGNVCGGVRGSVRGHVRGGGIIMATDTLFFIAVFIISFLIVNTY